MESSAPYTHPSEATDDTIETHYSSLERLRPHGCSEGLVYIGHLIEEDGEEVEIIEAVPCRQCNA